VPFVSCFSRIATLHEEQMLSHPVGQIFDVSTNGQGLMAGYGWPSPLDRRAIAACGREVRRKRQAGGTGARGPESWEAP
jgi:hypothetical protein